MRREGAAKFGLALLAHRDCQNCSQSLYPGQITPGQVAMRLFWLLARVCGQRLATASFASAFSGVAWLAATICVLESLLRSSAAPPRNFADRRRASLRRTPDVVPKIRLGWSSTRVDEIMRGASDPVDERKAAQPGDARRPRRLWLDGSRRKSARGGLRQRFTQPRRQRRGFEEPNGQVDDKDPLQGTL
jgi:hypothetical protein